MKRHLLALFLICFVGNCLAQTGEYGLYKRERHSAGNKKYEKWRIGLAGGAGYMFADSQKAEDDLAGMGVNRKKAEDYYKNYKWGWQGNADLHYMINPYLGIGAKYVLFSTSGKLEQISFENYNGDGLHVFFGDLDEKLYVNYVGPSVFGQYFVNPRKTWKVIGLISFGYTNYRSEGHIMEFPALITGHTFGGYNEFGMEYFPNRHIALGFNLNYLASFFRKFRVKNRQATQTVTLSRDEWENVSRFDFSLGLRFYL